jgi:hypothetical protein
MRWLVLALVACSSTPARAIKHTAATPSGPAPLVRRGGDYGLTADNVPAVSADGAQIVVAFREPDGDRGLPNLTLVMKGRDDTPLDRHVVLSVGEADQFLDDANGKNPALDARITRANAWLARLGFTAMIGTDGITVSWASSHLRVADGATVLVDRDTPASWAPEPQIRSTCEPRARLGATAVSRQHRLAVVTITFDAFGEFCTAPADQHHVVVW